MPTNLSTSTIPSNIRVRTISQLHPLSSDEITKDDLFEVSHNIGGRYQSQNISYDDLSSIINDNVNTLLDNKYGYKAEDNVTLSGLSESIKTLLSADLSIGGIKTFTDKLIYNRNDENTLSNEVATLNDIQNQIGTAPIYINNTALTAGYNYTEEDGVLSSSSDDSEFDLSVSTISKTSISRELPKTGFLSLYGWITARTTINSEEAWVMLEGSPDGKNNWKILQVQPFIYTNNSNVIQYVSFNLPVAAGIYIRIRTGFDVAENTSGFTSRSLIINKNGYTSPNTFIGIIFSGTSNT